MRTRNLDFRYGRSCLKMDDHAQSEWMDWMDARAREAGTSARAQSQQYKINYAGVIFTLLYFNTDTIASDFEEQLGAWCR